MSLSTYQASIFPTILCLQLTLIILDTYKKEKFSLWRSANSNSDFLPLIQRSVNVNKEVGCESSSSCRNKSGGSSWAGLNEISEELYFT